MTSLFKLLGNITSIDNSSKLSNHIRLHQTTFQEAYGAIVSKTMNQPLLLLAFGLTYGIGSIQQIFISGIWWHGLAALPLIIILSLIHPVFLKMPSFKKRAFHISNLVMLVYTLSLFIFYGAHKAAGTMSQVPSALFVLQIILIGFISTHPKRSISFLITFLLSGLYFIILGFCSFDVLKTNFPVLSQAWVMSSSINFIMNLMHRYRFYLKEQEKVIRERAEKIEKVFNSVGHAIFQIYSNVSGRIMIKGERSKSCDDFFGHLEDEADFKENFIDRLAMSPDRRSTIIEAINASLGESLISYELNSGSLPKSAIINSQTGQKDINITWAPLQLKIDQASAILISVSDVTLANLDKSNLIKAENDSKRTVEIHRLGRDRTKKAFTMIEAFMERTFRSLTTMKNSVMTKDALSDIFLPLHTIKGNARTLGLSLLSAAAHTAENTVETYRKLAVEDFSRINPDVMMQEIESELENMRDEIKKYQDCEISLGWVKKDIIEIDEQSIHIILQTTPWPKLKDIIRQGEDKTGGIEAFLALSSIRMQRLLQESFAGIKPLLKQLQKPEPIICINGEDLWLSREAADEIAPVLPHLFSNAMDHGIELPHERVRAGKNPQGQICIDIKVIGQGAIISFSDDGTGISPQLILKKALDMQIVALDKAAVLSEKEMALLIFHKGFSSREKVSEISGRGIGTSVVKETIENLGGEVSISFKDSAPSAIKRPFSIDLFIPSSHLT